MGRARRMVNGFMHDFTEGFREKNNLQDDHYRISSKVAATSADDYNDYQSNQIYADYGPYRRVGSDLNQAENAPLIEKSSPQLANVVEMLKHLQPKANVSNFLIRMARQLRLPRPTAQQFRFANHNGDEIQHFTKLYQHERVAAVNASKLPIDGDSTPVGVSRRSSFDNDIYGYGPPAGLPTFNHLPPADYSYYKDGTQHHIHDLRKEKDSYPSKGGGWLSFDFEDTILNALGLTHPGRAAKHTVLKCTKLYAFNALLRFFQTAFLG